MRSVHMQACEADPQVWKVWVTNTIHPVFPGKEVSLSEWVWCTMTEGKGEGGEGAHVKAQWAFPCYGEC